MGFHLPGREPPLPVRVTNMLVRSNTLSRLPFFFGARWFSSA